MNVAILSASRKVWLIEAFKCALRKTRPGTVYALDTDTYAVAFQSADKAQISPPSASPDFLQWLSSWCKRNEISLVVPTRDAELPVLASAAEDFLKNGVRVAVSPLRAVTICQDRRLFVANCRTLGFNTPREINPHSQGDFPAFLKPRFATETKGGERISTAAELQEHGFNPERELLQTFVSLPEFTIDVFIDWEGKLVSTVPRERVRVFATESIVGRTVRDIKLSDSAAQLAVGLGLRGHVTVQAFYDGTQVQFIEINPRFGGGAALGFAAGCPTPEWLIRLALSESLPSGAGQYEAGLWMFRDSCDIILPEALIKRPGPL